MAVDGNIKLGVDLVADTKSLSDLQSQIRKNLDMRGATSPKVIEDLKNSFAELYDIMSNTSLVKSNIFVDDTITSGASKVTKSLEEFSLEYKKILGDFSQPLDIAQLESFSTKVSSLAGVVEHLQMLLWQRHTKEEILDSDSLRQTDSQLQELLTHITQLSSRAREQASNQSLINSQELSYAIMALKDAKEHLRELNSGDILFTDVEYQETVNEIETLKQKIDELKAKMSEKPESSVLSEATSETETSQLEPVTQDIGKVTDNVNGLNSSISSVVSIINTQLGSSLTKFCQVGLSAFKKVASSAQSAFSKIGKQSGSLVKKLLMVGLGVRGIMALIRKLRTMVITSIKDLAKGDPTGEFAKSLNKLTMAFNTLKANIGIAFQPLLQVVMPILTQLINYVNEATTSLAKFFATLTGQDYIYKFTANNTDLAKSTKEVGKSAKKANKQLAQYDKLIVIAQDTDSGSGSGATDTSAGTYNKVGLGDSFNELAQMVKDAWANADFTTLGAMLGQKIQDGLNSIDWESIKRTAQKIGQSIATFLNGLISPETFSAITRTLAEGLNTVVTFFKSFGEAFDWENLGTSIASGLSTFFTTFDFYGFAQTISTYLNGILDTIIAFLMNMDWEAVGQSIIALIAGIDWAGIFDKLFTIIGGLAVGIVGILEGIFGDGLYAIGEGFFSIIDKISDGIDYFMTLFTNFRLFILEVVLNIVKYFKDHLGNLGTSASAPFISLKDKVVSALTSLKSSVSTIFTDIKTKITSIWDSVKTSVTDKVTSIKNVMTSAFTGAKNTLNTIFETIKSKVTSVFDSMKTNIKTKINGILTNIQNGINRVIGGINSLISKINGSSKALRDYLGWGSVKSIKTVSIPKLAKGAVIPPNREFMAILGDQKSGVNIETPLKTMIEAFNAALDSRGSGTNQPIILQVNGRQMAQVVWDENAKRYKQTGSYGLNY